VNATLYLEQRPNALAIRPLAIVPGKSGQTKSVFVVEQGKAHLVPIKTGIDDGSWVEVTEGLTGNEDVVLVGKGNITEGQTLAVSPYNLPAGTPARQKF
jgi:multidrug efflux pump subunit AcrA (membrane-fusion protein)